LLARRGSAAGCGCACTGAAAAGGGISLGSLADPNDYIAAHFDKKVNEESARQSLPVDGWRWQKRFFIFSGEGRGQYSCHAGGETADFLATCRRFP
jgi:hypothetical protein